MEDKHPKLKFYRDEHPVIVRPIWNEKNLLERAFELFAIKEDYVLGIYENIYFACMAEKKELSWYSVLPEGQKWFWGEREVEGKYVLIESLPTHNEKVYNIKRELLPDIKNEKKEMYKKVAIDYDLFERPSMSVGDTVDEILGYYIEKFLKEENISENKFYELIGVSRPIIRDIRANRIKLQGLKLGQKKIQEVSRAKKTIVRVAIYTKMPLVDAWRALKAVGDDFIEGHFQDEAIMEWMSGDRKSIKSLNETIYRYGEIMGITED